MIPDAAIGSDEKPWIEKTRRIVPKKESVPCPYCNFDLAGQPILQVIGRSPPWYFVRCPRCTLDVAIWKIGVAV